MEAQCLWDKCLIQAWRDDAKMGQLFFTFLRRIEEGAVIDIRDADIYLNAIGVTKRFATNDYGQLFGAEMVRSFIYNRCPSLSECLKRSDQPGNSDAEILRAMPYFKWVSKKSVTRALRAAHKRDRESIPVLPKNIYTHRNLRGRDKNTDWRTVK